MARGDVDTGAVICRIIEIKLGDRILDLAQIDVKVITRNDEVITLTYAGGGENVYRIANCLWPYLKEFRPIAVNDLKELMRTRP